jgi:hypothetical protein
MAVALVQEFKIVGSDRSTANYDHIAQRLDIDSPTRSEASSPSSNRCTSCTTAFAGVERARLGLSRRPAARR